MTPLLVNNYIIIYTVIVCKFGFLVNSAPSIPSPLPVQYTYTRVRNMWPSCMLKLASPDLSLHCREQVEGRHTRKDIKCVQDAATVHGMLGVRFVRCEVLAAMAELAYICWDV
jgi:hypothetical protein